MKYATPLCLMTIIGIVVLLSIRTSYATAQVTFGSLAPDFSLLDETNRLHTLSDLRGCRVALYFYPKDKTPGCTKQACSINDRFATLRDHQIQVLGISYDSPASHAAFKEKYRLSFPLLSDSDKKVATLYGVNGWFFAHRVTFLIDESGIVIDIIKQVDLKNHAQQILNGFLAHSHKPSE